MIITKSPREIALMREAGRVVAKVFDEVGEHLHSGMSTKEVADLAERVIRREGATPTFKGYGGFPGAICVSVNDTLIHGIPSKKIILKDGDIVSLDVGATLHGYVGDACRTYLIGHVDDETKRLVEVTKQSFYEGMKVVKPGARVGDISNAIQTYVESMGYTLTKDYTGHGVGTHLHEDPYVPNVGTAGTGPLLREGMVIAVEPMVNMGKVDLVVLDDGWTVKTKDGKNSAHYENTIVVTKDGYEILTAL
jgi:methionyl aminopeptidase